MIRLIYLLIALSVLTAISARAQADFAGTWDYTLQTPDSTLTGVLTLAADGGTISLAGEDVAFAAPVVQGDRITLSLSADRLIRAAVYGDVFKGRVTFPGMGSPEIRGVRRGPDGNPAFVLGRVNTNLTIRELLAVEGVKEIIDRHLPGFTGRDLDMAMDYPFRGVVSYMQLASEKDLYLIDVELSKLP